MNLMQAPENWLDAIKADGTYTAQFPYLAINIDFTKDEGFQEAYSLEEKNIQQDKRVVELRQ